MAFGFQLAKGPPSGRRSPDSKTTRRYLGVTRKAGRWDEKVKASGKVRMGWRFSVYASATAISEITVWLHRKMTDETVTSTSMVRELRHSSPQA